MTHYNLIETSTIDKPMRYSANGKRISYERSTHITTLARMYGQHDSFITKQIGVDKYKHYSSVRY